MKGAAHLLELMPVHLQQLHEPFASNSKVVKQTKKEIKGTGEPLTCLNSFLYTLTAAA